MPVPENRPASDLPRSRSRSPRPRTRLGSGTATPRPGLRPRARSRLTPSLGEGGLHAVDMSRPLRALALDVVEGICTRLIQLRGGGDEVGVGFAVDAAEHVSPQVRVDDGGPHLATQVAMLVPLPRPRRKLGFAHPRLGFICHLDHLPPYGRSPVAVPSMSQR